MKKNHILEIGGRLSFAALLFIGFAAFAIELGSEPRQRHVTRQEAQPIVEGPLESELRWCRHLGDEALQDKACLKAWAQNRERFLKYAPPKTLQPNQD